MIVCTLVWVVHCLFANQLGVIISRSENLLIESARNWSEKIRISPMINVRIECIEGNLAVLFQFLEFFIDESH